MNRLTTLGILTLVSLLFHSCSFNSDCGVQITDLKEGEALGQNLGFSITIKNNSQDTVEYIKYKVTYFDEQNAEKSSNTFSWDSDMITSDLEPGKEITDYELNWVSGAASSKAEILSVRHKGDNELCECTGNIFKEEN